MQIKSNGHQTFCATAQYYKEFNVPGLTFLLDDLVAPPILSLSVYLKETRNGGGEKKWALPSYASPARPNSPLSLIPSVATVRVATAAGAPAIPVAPARRRV